MLFFFQHVIDKTKQTLIFCSTRHHVEYLSNLLTQANIANTYSYSSLDPTGESRKSVFALSDQACIETRSLSPLLTV